MQTYWTSLAADGDPNGSGPQKAPLVVWPAYDGATDRHLTMGADGTLSVGHGLSKKQCDFWAGLPPNPW